MTPTLPVQVPQALKVPSKGGIAWRRIPRVVVAALVLVPLAVVAAFATWLLEHAKHALLSED